MTLGGLAIAIGEVVDDAVIGVENVVRRLRENRRSSEPRAEARVVLDAMLEMRAAVVYATFAGLLVFFPIFALSGVAGRLFGPLGIAYIVAVLASLVVALTVTPALSMFLLVGGAARNEEHEPPLVRWSRRHYEALLLRIGRFPRLLIATAVLLTMAGVGMLPFFRGTFLPDLREGHLILHVSAIPGTSLDESLRIGKLISDSVQTIPGVRSVAQHAGRAEAGVDTVGPHSSEFEVDLRPGLSGENQELAEKRMRAILANFPGIVFSIKTYLTERIEETVSGFTAAVVVNVYGPDLDSLENAARDVARELGEVPGAIDIQQQSPPGMPQVNVTLRPTDLHRWGLDAVEVLELIRTAYQGDVVGQAYEGNVVFNVIVKLDEHARARLTQIGDMPIRTPSGTYVLLKQIADVYQTSGRYQVLHSDAQRVQTVTANVSGRDLESFVADAKRKIARTVKLPPGAHVEFAGTAEAQARSRRDLLVNSLLAATGIILLLLFVTGHWRNLVLVLINLPFAFVGGIFAAALTGGLLSLGSMVGFVTLFGITLRNSILMISHYEHLVVLEGRAWGLETAIRGRGRPPHSDPDDLASDRPRFDAARARRGRAGPRNRRADGHCHPRWALDFDGAESSGPSDTCVALCALRQRSAGCEAREGDGIVTEIGDQSAPDKNGNLMSQGPPLPKHGHRSSDCPAGYGCWVSSACSANLRPGLPPGHTGDLSVEVLRLSRAARHEARRARALTAMPTRKGRNLRLRCPRRSSPLQYCAVM